MKPDDEDDDLAFRKGDHVQIRGTNETGRIAREGSKPGYWIVRFYDRSEREVAESDPEPVY
jgi:hypothetical protein